VTTASVFACPLPAHWQRADREGGLTVDVERLAAGGEHGDGRRRQEDGLGQFRAGVDEVLARVKNEQQAAVAEVREQRVARRGLRLVGQPQPARDRVRHQFRVVHRGELHQAGSLREPWFRRLGGARRDTGLADTARSDQRDEPRIAQQFANLAELRCPLDELVCLRGKQACPRGLSDTHVTPSCKSGRFA
jgi:hypothetical protein